MIIGRRMKSVISPSTITTLRSPSLSKPSSSSSSSSSSTNSLLPFQTLNFLPTRKRAAISPPPLTFRTPNHYFRNSTLRCLHTDNSLQSSSPSSGEIHVIVGPMFAGKTTTLLHRIKSECSNGRNVAIIKSNKDTRYGLDSIVTHDGLKLPCWPLEVLSSFRQRIGSDAYHKLDVIGIDEAQFFGDLYDFCSKVADHDGKTVIVAGLDGDYLRRSFGSVLDIIPIADSVTKLTARCELCGKPASFTLRKTEETRTELIAGADVYMPVCRQHYVSGQVVKEAARSVLETQKVQCGL